MASRRSSKLLIPNTLESFECPSLNVNNQLYAIFVYFRRLLLFHILQLGRLRSWTYDSVLSTVTTEVLDAITQTIRVFQRVGCHRTPCHIGKWASLKLLSNNPLVAPYPVGLPEFSYTGFRVVPVVLR